MFQAPAPPHGQLFDVLSEAEHAELLTWVMDHESAFEPARVRGRDDEVGHIDSDVRSALKLGDLGPVQEKIRRRLTLRLPDIMDMTDYRGPPPLSLEFELNAYGEGGHFAPHIDSFSGVERTVGVHRGEDRILTAVYYFYREPKGFTGGALRLFRFPIHGDGAAIDDAITFEPRQNSLVVFPAWARHAVDRVGCASGRFADFRFALNCWFCRARAG